MSISDKEQMLTLKEQVAGLEKKLEKQKKISEILATELLFVQDKWWPFVHDSHPSIDARGQADRNRKVLEIYSEVKYEQR